MINLCIEYEKENVITKNSIYKNVKIGKWLSHKKEYYKKDKLMKEEKEKLINLNYFKKWINDGGNKIIIKKLNFDEMINLCIEYEKENEIKARTIYKKFNIGSWINTQKDKYKKKKLDKDKIDKLLKIKYFKNWLDNDGDKLNVVKNPKFNNMVKLCIEFQLKSKLNGSSIYKNIKIGAWIDRQKQKFKQNKLTEDQLIQLKKITYWKEWLETLT